MSQQKKDHMIVLKLENMHVTDTNMTEEDDEDVDPGWFPTNKLECILPMGVVSILHHAEFGPNGHREDVPHFIR